MCHLEPVQEGEGDPSPENVRQINGTLRVTVTRTGKNLWRAPYRRISSTLRYTLNGSGCVVVNGTVGTGAVTDTGAIGAFQYTELLRLPAGTYTVSSTGLASVQHLVRIANQDNMISPKETYTGLQAKSITFTLTEAERVLLSLWIAAGTVCDEMVTRPQLQAGEDETDYAPAEVDQLTIALPTGDSIFADDASLWKQGSINANTGASSGSAANRIRSDYIAVVPGRKYLAKASDGYAFWIYQYDAEKTFVAVLNNATYPMEQSDHEYIVPAGVRYVRLVFKATDNAAITPAIIGTAHAYLYDASVYGAEYSDETGVLKITKICYTFTGSETFNGITDVGGGYTSMYKSGASMGGRSVPASDGVNGLKFFSHGIIKANLTERSCHAWFSSADGINLYLVLPCTATAASIQEYLAAQYAAGTPVQCCWTLGTPNLVQLDPQELHAAPGVQVNHVWPDYGTITVRGQEELGYALSQLT